MLCGDDILAENANEKHYKTLLAEKQANMTTTRMMNELFSTIQRSAQQ